MSDDSFDTIISEESEGIYAWPAAPNENYKIREILDYCKVRGIKTSELSEEDMEQFMRGHDE